MTTVTPPDVGPAVIGRIAIVAGGLVTGGLVGRRLDAVSARARGSLRSLAALAAALDLGRRLALRTARGVVGRLATAPIVNWAVDAQLERIAWPLVPRVVDTVLATLYAEPERVRALIRGQRESLGEEVLGHVRSGAAAGDAAVDRFVAGLRVRRPGAEPAPSAAGEPRTALPRTGS